MRSVVVVGIAVLASAAGCLRHLRGERHTIAAPTCASACAYYVDCRGSSDPDLDAACLAECEGIYVTGGVTDAASLRAFEDLECPDVIAFVEGPSGRRPGADQTSSRQP